MHTYAEKDGQNEPSKKQVVWFEHGCIQTNEFSTLQVIKNRFSWTIETK